MRETTWILRIPTSLLDKEKARPLAQTIDVNPSCESVPTNVVFYGLQTMRIDNEDMHALF